MTDWVERVWDRWGAEIFLVVAIVVTIVFMTDGIDCGGDAEGTGAIVDDVGIERRIENAVRDQGGGDLTFDCPDDGIEVGTDFSCVGTDESVEDLVVHIDTHLDSDGETIEPFNLKPIYPGERRW